jgi:hypothetical protein
MLEVKEEELKKILPSDGPSIDEVKKYLENIMTNTLLLNVVEVF